MPPFVPPDDQWTSGPQPGPFSADRQGIGWTGFGAGVGALALLGHARFKPNYTGFDLFTDIARGVEEYSPGRVLRTFQVSHMLSPLETASRQSRYFSPAIISKLRGTAHGREWLDHISRLTGEDIVSSQVAVKGFRYEAGQLLLGQTDKDILLRHAGVIRSPTAAQPFFQEAYARSLAGGPLNIRRALESKVPFIGAEGKPAEELFMFTGGQSRLQRLGRGVSGYGTFLIERFNRLANAPAEMPVVRDIFSKIPILNKGLGVAPSSGLKTLGKLSLKLGLGLPAGYLAYKQLDYWTRESAILDSTVLAEGITAAGATVWAKANMALSTVADWLGLHTYREKQEEIAPRSTDLSTILGFPILGAFTGLTAGYVGRTWRQAAYQRGGLSLSQASVATSAEDAFFKEAIYGTTKTKTLSSLSGMDTRIPPSLLAELDPKTLQVVEGLTEKRVAGWQGKVASHLRDLMPKRNISGFLARTLGELTPSKISTLIGAGIGAAVIAPFIPGAFIPSKRPEELEAIYSGKERIPVRKGRWWEAGSTPFEGGRIDYYRQHWYPRMLARAKEKSIYGEGVSPLTQWYRKNFTYDIEQQHYYDRPYPTTSPAFQSTPIVGPLLGATIGKFVKPTRIMHPEAFMREGPAGEEYKQMPLGFGETTIAPELGGELPVGAPISPFGFKGTAGEQLDTMADVIGLPGFTFKSIKKAITGVPGIYEQEQQLASAGDIYSPARNYYEEEWGGIAGLSEFGRRLYPRPRKIDKYNPIENTMPSWLPGPGERSEDFSIGDPFTKIPLGEERLPGAGLAALYPELEGVAPEDYSPLWKLRVLADVAPYSDKYRGQLGKVRGLIRDKQLSPEEMDIFKQTMAEVEARKERIEFSPYKYRDRVDTPMEEVLAAANEETKRDPAEPSWFDRTVGGYWETLGHTVSASPLEYITPIRPAQKFIHMKTPIEDYEQTQLYGTRNAFWDHPIRDFFAPFISSSASLVSDSLPERVKEKREVMEYFDMLKYVKYTRLKRQAQIAGDEETIAQYEQKRRETLFGVNPYTHNYKQIFRALPREERDYFNEFIEADMEGRQRILEMVPDNEKALYMARWQMKDAGDMQKAVKEGLLSEEQVEKSKVIMEGLYEQRETEGLPKDKALWAEYLQTRLRGESYADWYRRVYLLEKVLDGRSLPSPSWVGFHPSVDLDDIKLKVVQYEGQNAIEHDLWPDRARAVARKPIINDAAEELRGAMEQREDPRITRDKILSILGKNGIMNPHITMVPSTRNSIDLQLDEDRTGDIVGLYRGGELD